METTGAYRLVRDLVESLGGTSEFRKGGGPGGVWVFNLRGRALMVDARDRSINALDRLYVHKAAVAEPTSWEDYEQDAPLRDDAFWQLLRLDWR